MPDIGEQTPLNPLYPVNPPRRPEKRDHPKPSDQKHKSERKNQPPDEDDGKPHVDEYA
ncbi:MAG: hypothetical protein ABFR65_11210 [Pseudomonadota bacterium]